MCPLVDVSFGVVVGPYRSSVDAPCFDAPYAALHPGLFRVVEVVDGHLCSGRQTPIKDHTFAHS